MDDAAKMVEVVEEYDNWAALRHGLSRIADTEDEWAGIPMPLEGQTLRVDPSYKFAPAFAKPEEPEDTGGATLRNTFWSWRYRSYVMVWQEADGRIAWGPTRASNNRLSLELSTLGASDAWGIAQEHTALMLLGTLVRHRQFKQYMLTGMFLETSGRSGVTYLFRKLRPTVALTMRGDRPRILCALCLHPIAYYSDSWAGAMCPSDDLIAHLMLMRGDEAMFWRRAKQHAAFEAGAGLD